MSKREPFLQHISHFKAPLYGDTVNYLQRTNPFHGLMLEPDVARSMDRVIKAIMESISVLQDAILRSESDPRLSHPAVQTLGRIVQVVSCERCGVRTEETTTVGGIRLVVRLLDFKLEVLHCQELVLYFAKPEDELPHVAKSRLKWLEQAHTVLDEQLREQKMLRRWDRWEQEEVLAEIGQALPKGSEEVLWTDEDQKLLEAWNSRPEEERMLSSAWRLMDPSALLDAMIEDDDPDGRLSSGAITGLQLFVQSSYLHSPYMTVGRWLANQISNADNINDLECGVNDIAPLRLDDLIEVRSEWRRIPKSDSQAFEWSVEVPRAKKYMLDGTTEDDALEVLVEVQGIENGKGKILLFLLHRGNWGWRIHAVLVQGQEVVQGETISSVLQGVNQ